MVSYNTKRVPGNLSQQNTRDTQEEWPRLYISLTGRSVSVVGFSVVRRASRAPPVKRVSRGTTVKTTDVQRIDQRRQEQRQWTHRISKTNKKKWVFYLLCHTVDDVAWSHQRTVQRTSSPGPGNVLTDDVVTGMIGCTVYIPTTCCSSMFACIAPANVTTQQEDSQGEQVSVARLPPSPKM